MNGDLENLIEEIATSTNDGVELFASVVLIADPVERFRALEDFSISGQDLFGVVLRKAKALTIDEIRQQPDKPSLKAIGEILGVSAQRVHQLANPTHRRSTWKKKEQSHNS